MISPSLLHTEVRLKDVVAMSKDQKPQFEWDVLLDGTTAAQANSIIKVRVGEHERDFNAGEIANTIGNALTDMFLAQQQNKDGIFTDENRQLVRFISEAVSTELQASTGTQARTLAASEIYHLIERALVKHNKHDLAHCLVTRRQNRETSEHHTTPQPTLMNTKVIRRNGSLAPWFPNKIEVAVRKAFLSLALDSAPAIAITESVTRQVADQERTLINIEEVQALVEEELMRQGHYKVARAYIQYRSLRAHLRDEDEASAREQAEIDFQQDSLIVVKSSPTDTFLWDGTDLKKRVDYAMLGLDLCLTRNEIEHELRRSVFTDITAESLKRTIILNAKSLMGRDADFAKFAARILLTYIYEEVLGWDIIRDGTEALATFHRRAFKKNLQRCVDIERVHPDMMGHDLDKLADALDPTADLDFDYLGIQTLYDRYLLVDKKTTPERRIETPQLFWMRVAMGLFIRELREGQPGTADGVIALYRLYKGRRFCSSTPTLFNSGTLHSQLSSCYLYKVDDSIESIMQRGIAENAYLSKWAGGLGGSWTAVRGTGGYIKGTNGESQGVIPFLKLHNDQLVAVNQGGKRRGSGCAYLEIWHNDMEDFLQLKINTGDERRRTPDLNTANWIPDLFMKRLEARQPWTLFRANEVPDLHELYGKAFEERYTHYEALAQQGKIWSRQIPAVELWRNMLKCIFETGHPWMTFKDPCNLRSPQDHCGVIHSSNLCTEITLNTGEDETAVCNLGSVLIESHLDDKNNIDHAKLRETIRTAVRVLDNVIDINYYPTGPAKNANSRHRPIGLGVMGLAYALYQKGIPFGSKEAIEFNDEFMEAIAYYAYEASSDLAAERGQYKSYKGSKWDRGLLPQDTLDILEEQRGVAIDIPRGGKMDWSTLRAKIAAQGMRNSNVLAIAPTATISNIMASSPCIEPLFSNSFGKGNLSGDFVVLNPYLVRDLKKRGLWNQSVQEQLTATEGELASIEEIPSDLKRKYATAFGIDPSYLIDAAARRQKWIDQSQSVNLFYAGKELPPLSQMYRSAWKQGLKTTYYLRTPSASNIEKANQARTKDIRGVMAQAAGIPQAAAADSEKPVYTEEQKQACSIQARANGGSCEACE